MKESIEVFIEQMEQRASVVKGAIDAFMSNIVYSNPGDREYLGQLRGDLEGTTRCLNRLKEIIKQSH